MKGRIAGAATVTITRNEILTAFNKPDDWILALVEVPPREDLPIDVTDSLLKEPGVEYVTGEGCRVRYVRRPFQREPDFYAVSVNYDWKQFWEQGFPPKTVVPHTPSQ